MTMGGKVDKRFLRSMVSDLHSLGIQLYLHGGSDNIALDMYQVASCLLALALHDAAYRGGSIREAMEKLSIGKKRLQSHTSRECNDSSPSDEHIDIEEGNLDTRMISRPLNILTPTHVTDMISVKQDLATIIHNMGLLYFRNNSYFTAEQMFRLAIQTVADDCDSVLLLQASQNNLGHIAYCLKKHDDAVEHFSEALRLMAVDLCEQKGGQQGSSEQHSLHKNIIVTNHAVALFAIGEAREQIGMLNEAMTIFVRIVRTRQAHPCEVKDNRACFVYALAMRKIGNGYYLNGDLDMAIKALEFSLVLWKQASVGLSKTQDLASLIQDIDIAQMEAGGLPKAVEYFEECLRLRSNLFGCNHVEVSNALYYIGGVHQDLGNYPDALDAYNEAVLIEKIVFGQHHPEVATTLARIGEVYQECGQLCDALKAYKEALCIAQQSGGEVDSSLFEIHQAIGAILVSQGNTSGALVAFSAARRIQHAVGRHQPVDTSIQAKGNTSDLQDMTMFPGAAAA